MLDSSPYAFTKKYEKKVDTLYTEVVISEPFDPDEATIGETIVADGFVAIWDTGATGVVITKKVVSALGLSRINRTTLHGVHGDRPANVYKVNMALPNKIMIPLVTVVETGDALSHQSDDIQADVLIGMEIIGKGDFAVTHKNGYSCMTFQMPSTHHIDFVED